MLQPTDSLTLTADVYRIDIDDRITLSSNLVLNDAARAYLQANGVGDIDYTSARYFTNAVDTHTTGIDLVANYRYQFDNGIRWNSTVGYNYNHTKVTEVKANPAVLDALGVNLQRVDRREKNGLLGDTNPGHKLTLGNDFNYGNWALRGAWPVRPRRCSCLGGGGVWAWRTPGTGLDEESLHSTPRRENAHLSDLTSSVFSKLYQGASFTAIPEMAKTV